MVSQSRQRRRRQNNWWVVGGVVVLAAAVWIGWTVLRPEPTAVSEGLVTTLIGKPAPVLRLSDADGRAYTVPEPGRPTVLIFHMGLF